MDEAVLESIRRWPNVPAVYGWLSLSARGQWRLHPDGQAMAGSAGESIQNAQILRFINRNYASDEQGRWFFQNGPQRVYVRLDAAPLIARADTGSGQLIDHTGRAIESIERWLVDVEGHLFFQSTHGAGLILDRDLAVLAEVLSTERGETLTQWWEDPMSQSTVAADPSGQWFALGRPAPLERLSADKHIDQRLGFVRNPVPATETS